jgi:predicted enzyme related to lactoylglutathione lyase
MPTVWVRYIVNDLGAALAFYTQQLGFSIDQHPGPGFAAISRGELQLLLTNPSGSGGAARPTSDGRRPEAGGWNRIQLRTRTLEADVERLRTAGVHMRNAIVDGNGGRQILIEDPSGNPIELFEPRQQTR